MRRYRRPPRLAPLASEGGGTEKRTLHVLQKPDISFATDMSHPLSLAGFPISFYPFSSSTIHYDNLLYRRVREAHKPRSAEG